MKLFRQLGILVCPMMVGAAAAVACIGLASPLPADASATDTTVLYGWGKSLEGQIGNGRSGIDGQLTPAPVLGQGGSDVVQIAGGTGHTVALHADGTVWTWGGNGLGQLGDGSPETIRTTPAQVPGLSGIKSIGAGAFFSLAVGTDGSLWAWGDNNNNQLGIPNTPTERVRTTPVRVPAPTGIIQAVGGLNFTSVLRSNGEVWSWGNNLVGSLGDKSTLSSLTPVRTALPWGIKQIAAGSKHGVALRDDGSVWAWGQNTSGELGDGSTVAFNATPVRVDRHVAGAIAVAAGEDHSMALGGDNTVWTWGRNNLGQLGDSSINDSRLPVHLNLTGITQIAAGTRNGMAVHSDGTLSAWGDNFYGQIGNGTSNTFRTTPVKVPGLAGVSHVWSSGGTMRAVATAPPPVPVPAPQPVAVPNLFGQLKSQASSTLESVGLHLGLAGTIPDDRTCNHLFEVVGQDPAAGTVVPPGTAVNITTAVAPSLPCF